MGDAPAAKKGRKEVGFIGLGIMGEGMARNLLKAGRALTVWNRSPAKAEALKAGAADGQVTIVDSPAAVVAACGLTVCMLSTPDACREVYEEQRGGLLSGVSAGKCIIDCATLSPDDMQRMARQVRDKGGRFLEAPVSGSKGPAAAGQLVFLAAGDEALFKEASGELEAMGKASFFFGDVGGGTQMKLAVNMIMGTMACALGEGVGLCQAAGIDAAKLIEVLDLGAMACPLFKLKGPKMIAGDHAPNFPLRHAHKDMYLAGELGRQVGLALPVAYSAQEAMKRARDDGLCDQDFAAVYESQKRQRLGGGRGDVDGADAGDYDG